MPTLPSLRAALIVAVTSCAMTAPLFAQAPRRTTPRPSTGTPSALQYLQQQNDSLRRVIDSLRTALRPEAPSATVVAATTEAGAATAPQASTSAPTAGTGPFGLTLGMDFAAFKQRYGLDSSGTQSGIYTVRRVPRPMSEFESVTVVAAPKAGVCKISGVGVTIESNSFGNQVQSAFASLRDLVTEKYGTGKTFDFLQSGSIWNEREDWMMGLVKKERTLMAVWSKAMDSTLPPTITAIMLEAHALSRDKAYLRLAFEGPNMDACIKALKPNALGD